MNSSKFDIPRYKKYFYDQIRWVLHFLSIFNLASQSILYLPKISPLKAHGPVGVSPEEATKMLTGLGRLSSADRLGELGLHSLEK